MAMTAPKGPREVQVFLRRSSGLTRQIGPWDALMYGAMNPGLLFSMVYIVWTPYLYPGAHMGLAVLTVLAMFFPAAVYWFYSVAMPRSGGEYLYISRTLHPALGLMSSFVISVTAISWCGILTDWWMKWALADSFYGVGLITHNPAMVSITNALHNEWFRTVLGSASLAATGWLFMRGSKYMMRVSWIAVGFALMGVIVWLISGMTGASHFAANWTAMTGVKYSAILAAAKAGHYLLKFTFIGTLMGGLTYVVLNTLGATFSANIAGEIRGVQKSQMLALFGSLVIQMILWFAFYQGSYSFQGAIWTNALMWAYNSGAHIYPLGGHMPFATILVAILTKSPVAVALIAAAFFVATWASAAGLAFAPTRNIFAWGFDRMIPAKFTEINRKYGSPSTTVWVTILVAWIFMIMDIWVPTWTADIAYTISAWFIGWIILGIAAILFPYVKPDLFESSPPVVQSRFLGVPVISIFGLLTLAVSVFIEWSMIQPYLAGTLPYTYLVMTVIFMVIPLLMYWIAAAYHSGKGIPLSQQFATIPPE